MSTQDSGAAPVTGLRACPDSPNCVSSQAADAPHHIQPFAFAGSPDAVWHAVKQVVASEARMRIVEESGFHLKAEATSLVLRFVDDVELMLMPEEHIIQVRSASRVGYSDFGVNRRRIERIRERLKELGAID